METLIGLDFTWMVLAGLNWGRVLVCICWQALCSRLQGKVFPKLRKRLPQGSGSTDSVSDKEEDEATDYVFRILFPNSQSEFGESFFHRSEQIIYSSFGPLQIVVACFCDCNPSFPSTDLFPLQSTECNISLVLPPGCLKESLTQWKTPEYCHILSSSVSLPRFNSLHLISSRLALCLRHTLLIKVPPPPLPATLCYTFSAALHGTNLLTGDGWTTAWSNRVSKLIRFKLN